MKKHCGVVFALAAVFVLSGSVLHAQRVVSFNQVNSRLRPVSRHLVALRVDPDTGEVRNQSPDGRLMINSSFSMVSATCINCGGGCPSFSRSVDVVLQANIAVAGGYGVSGLTSANYTVTGITYSTQAALIPGQQVTVTITGNVLDCSTWFNVYFNMCDNMPVNWSDSCPVSFGTVAVLNTNAATDAGNDYWPQVATDRAGNWVAVWYSNENLGGVIGPDDDIFVSLSTDNGVTWTPPAALNTNAASDSGNDQAPQVVTDGAGNWVAVWHSDDTLSGSIGSDWDVLVARSTDNGVTWSAPVALNTNAASDLGDDLRPQVAEDGTGNWVAVWYSSENLGGAIGTDNDIFVARSTDNGVTWTAPAALNSNATSDSGADYTPQVVTDGVGNWVTVWHSNDTLIGTVGTDYDIFYSRSVDAGLSWTPVAALNSNAGSDSGNDYYPRTAVDTAGNWVTVWYSNENLGGVIGTDNDIFVSNSGDGGNTWTFPAALNTNAASDTGADYEAMVATDGTGKWVVAWYSNENVGGAIGVDYDILLARSADGGVNWTFPAALNANAAVDSGGDFLPYVVTDGVGNWLAAWYSGENLGGTIGTDFDIFVALGR